MTSKNRLLSIVYQAMLKDFELFDKYLAGLHKSPIIMEDFIIWAINLGLADKDFKVRYLAICIIRNSHGEFDQQQIKKLRQAMRQEDNFYIQAITAYVLFASGQRQPAIVNKLKEVAAYDSL